MSSLIPSNAIFANFSLKRKGSCSSVLRCFSLKTIQSKLQKENICSPNLSFHPSMEPSKLSKLILGDPIGTSSRVDAFSSFPFLSSVYFHLEGWLGRMWGLYDSCLANHGIEEQLWIDWSRILPCSFSLVLLLISSPQPLPSTSTHSSPSDNTYTHSSKGR
jgi:hypothetical protein